MNRMTQQQNIYASVIANAETTPWLEEYTKTSDFKSHRVFHRREPLFCAGEKFKGIYILRAGSAKSFITSRDGDEHITQFHYPGELLGVDGFDHGLHTQNVRFLETSSVCFIHCAEIDRLMRTSESFRNSLLQSMSHTLACDNSMMMCLSVCSSEQRLAKFLLELSANFSHRGLSGTDFMLSMTRTDIANYLGMAIETVSRMLASFQQKNVIAIKHRHITILDLNALNGLLSLDFNSHLSRPEPHAQGLMQVAS